MWSVYLLKQLLSFQELRPVTWRLHNVSQKEEASLRMKVVWYMMNKCLLNLYQCPLVAFPAVEQQN